MIAAVVVVTASIIHATPATAHHTNNSGYVYSGASSDYYYNFDYLSTGSHAGTNADWFVTMIFTNGAEVDLIKNGLTAWGFTHSGSTKYGRISENGTGSFVWDADGGRDEALCPIQAHYRLYADSDDQIGYNTNWGYFVVATTHQDRYHICAGTDLFGWSEDSSNQVAAWSANAWGAGDVFYDNISTLNSVTSHWSDSNTRWWQNDGLAHRVRI